MGTSLLVVVVVECLSVATLVVSFVVGDVWRSFVELLRVSRNVWFVTGKGMFNQRETRRRRGDTKDSGAKSLGLQL